MALIRKIFHVEAESGRITSEELEFRFGSMTDEEKAVEDQIAIMLSSSIRATVHFEASSITSANDILLSHSLL